MCGCYTSTREDELRLHVHVFPRRKDGTIDDHEVLDDVRIGDGDKELVTNGEGEKTAVSLRPFVEG